MINNKSAKQKTLFESYREERLFERLCAQTQLEKGFAAVKRNGGSAGIDKQTIDDFAANVKEEIRKLSEELSNWTYNPQPVRRVNIPKPEGKGTRSLGVPCVRDRVVQATIKQLLEPILDPGFSEHSYGFRPGKNQKQAIEAAQEIIRRGGKEIVVDIDLSKFFDRIQHDRMIHRLSERIKDKRMIRIIGMTLRSGVMENGVVTATTEGSVQGSPLSPLLSNFVLDELDKELETRGLEFCRFADDCNIYVKSRRAGERVMASVRKFIENRLKLVVNEEKSKVARTEQVKFLGFTILKGTIVIARKSMSKAMAKVKELTPRGTNRTLEETIEAINRWYKGWSGYFLITQYPSQFKAIEAHIRRRLRARIISQQKKKRHLFNLLIKQGISRQRAGTIYQNKRRWALSHLSCVESAFPNKWFSDQKGLFIRSAEEHEQWFSLKLWPVLT